MTLPYTYIKIHVCKSHKEMGGLSYETSPYGFHHPSTIHAQRDDIHKSQTKFVQANWSNSTSMQIVSTQFSSSSSSSVIRVWVVVCGGIKERVE